MRYFDPHNTTIKQIKSGCFLSIYADISESWSGTDRPDRYEQNLKIKPENWRWRDQTIRYTLNSQHYRCPEWTEIDWKSSILIFGCSHVFGVGVNDTDTISHQLSQILAKPVINLGVPGSSILFSFNNALQYLVGNRPYPAAVINLWTDMSRTMTYQHRVIRSHGQWNAVQGDEFDYYNKYSTNPKVHALQLEQASKLLWKKTHYCSASLFTDTAKTLSIQDLSPLCDLDDRARDDLHFGPETYSHIAEHLADKLKF